MAKIQATVRLNKSGPLTHTGRGGRTIKRGQKVTLTDPEEIAYYQSIGGIDVRITQGKLASRTPVDPEPDIEDDDDDTDDDDEGEGEDEVDGLYDKADLKKMTRKDLVALADDDEELPLTKADLKGLKKKEVIAAIMAAQGEDEDEDEDEEDDEEDDD